MKTPDSTFWKGKLTAFLHDTPSKCLDIKNHEQRAREAMNAAGLNGANKEFERGADWAAASADRFPFPHYSKLKCEFDGVSSRFRHPLNGDDTFTFDKKFTSPEIGIEGEKSIQPRLQEAALKALPENDQWRARYFAHWRLWQKFAIDHDPRFGFLVADTRIPDHTIWNHMSVVAALSTCSYDGASSPKAAFLKFQVGPVQDFIAAARSTRDLWSGSYLLSWLMAAGLKRLSELAGPDAVIFPNLFNQPLFDLHWKEDLWDKVHIGSQKDGQPIPCWEALGWDKDQLQTPNLPNVFLAIVPQDHSEAIAREVSAAIHAEWQRIAASVWSFMAQAGAWDKQLAGLSADDVKRRFDAHVGQHLAISWQTTAWPADLDAAESLIANIPAITVSTAPGKPSMLERFRITRRMAEEIMPAEDRDKRYYTSDKKNRLSNIGLAWSLITSLNSWQMDAVRSARAFNGWPDTAPKIGTANNKDALTGKEEMVAGGQAFASRLSPELRHRFKKDDWVGAITLVKRIWDLSYLHSKESSWSSALGDRPQAIPDTRSLARMRPFSDSSEDTADGESNGESDLYFAVLAFDGDQIGKWVSGAKCPPFGSQLASYPGESQTPVGSRAYFESLKSGADGDAIAEFLATPRPLSPGYHLQFSEALSNFALHCARPIVESYAGRLIYAGGDDVLALLPAGTVLDCAIALQQAFKGMEIDTNNLPEFQSEGDGPRTRAPRAKTHPHNLSRAHPGFLQHPNAENGPLTPFIVPGSKATASVGIAVAHFKSPLQSVVKAAQRAEKTAKGKYGRNAVAITTMKHSGEILTWGCKFSSEKNSEQSGGLRFLDTLLGFRRDDKISAKFPHRLIELLNPYLCRSSGLDGLDSKPGKAIGDASSFPVDEVIQRELAHTIGRQKTEKLGKCHAEELHSAINEYLAEIEAAFTINAEHSSLVQHKLTAVIDLCRSAAFMLRISKDQTA